MTERGREQKRGETVEGEDSGSRSNARRLDRASRNARQQAMYLAKAVRDGIEDFHCKHLTDAQMRELNPLIRDAICTALHALETYDESEAARIFVDESLRQIPDYWEEPQLKESYLGFLRDLGEA